MWVRALVWEDPLEKEMASMVFLPGEPQGQRNLVYGAKESDMTEQLNHPHGLPRWY